MTTDIKFMDVGCEPRAYCNNFCCKPHIKGIVRVYRGANFILFAGEVEPMYLTSINEAQAWATSIITTCWRQRRCVSTLQMFAHTVHASHIKQQAMSWIRYNRPQPMSNFVSKGGPSKIQPAW